MELEEYLFFYGISKLRFAEHCGVTRATITNIVSGRNCASIPLALRIEDLTGGKVEAFTLVSDLYMPRLEKAQEFNEKHNSEGNN